MTDPENIVFCYEPINMRNNITGQYQRHIKNPVELIQLNSFTNIVNGLKVIK